MNRGYEEIMKNIYMYFEMYPGFMNAEYFKIFTLTIYIGAISVLLFVVAYVLSLNTMKDAEKLGQYECGFKPLDEATRQQFDVHFYMVGILFLIFDVEVSLVFPWALGMKLENWFGFISMALFILVLAIGFFFEWHRGALLWPKEQLRLEKRKKAKK